MKKITYLITHNDNGGAQDAIYKTKNINLSGYNSELYCLYSVNQFSPIPALTYNKRRYLRNITAIIMFVRYLIENKPDVVISFLPFANVVNGFFSLFFRYKSIISHRNPIWTYSLTMRLIDCICAFFGMYDHVLCNSKAVQSSLNNNFYRKKTKVSILNNFVVSDSVALDRENLERQLGFSLSTKYAVAIGRMSRQKRFDILIDACKNIDIQLIIAGDGELRESLIKRSDFSHKIKFVGHVSNNVVKSLLKYSHIYLQPSEFEGQSNSLLEAIQYDLVILSSDIPPQREVLEHEGCVGGVLIKSYDPLIWEQHISAYCNLKREMFSVELARLREIYSPESTKKRLELVLDTLFN